MSEEIVQAELQITGRVQGVWYRASAQREAQRLGLRGWVRNREDGAVEAIAEGPRGDLEAFIQWCRRGPPAAEVEDVEVSWRPASGSFPAFDILR